MRKWYSECNNPTDRLLERYVTELNESATRHDRAQLTVHNLRNWWKNERQREKKHGPRTMKFQEPRPCFTYYDETAANPASGKVHITFDTVHEIPLLRHWYTSNKKPSNELLQHYANTLNHSPVRDGKPKVNYHKLRNWWNNEKQRERKSEQHQLPRRGPGRPPKYPALNEQAKTTDNSAATATSGAEPYYKRQRTSDHHQQGERPVSQNEQPPVAPSSPPLQLTNLVNSPSRASGIQRSSPISQSLNFHHHGLDLLAESQFYGGHAPGAMMFTAYQPSSSTPLFPSPSPYRPLSLSNARESPSERSSQHSNKDNT
ncbi:uncharacterized protein LOC141910189 [Tubulanus polymorphus]|uniref:uncharacterized protein LOC141910189 n=1 Tax=Tubulanus polymorphus TaxID=672921 RepID=UPI003DA27B23